jgi:hypothetical protein
MFLRILSMCLAVGIMASCTTKQNTEADDTATDSTRGYNAKLFAINGTTIKGGSSDSVEQSSKRFQDVNFSGPEAFWSGHKQYFVHAMGVIIFPKATSYTFRLSNSGKIVFRINNVDVFKVETAKDTVLQQASYVQEGKNIFEFEYFDGGLDPKVILEWSEDGRTFAVIPPEMFTQIESTGQVKVTDAASKKDSVTVHNVLTDQEKKEGWKLLFDGKTTSGWHSFNKPGSVGSKWKVEDGVLTFEGRNRFRYELEGRVIEMGDTDKKADGGLDIVSDEAFENFEMKLDWKISEGGNSGIFYTVKEDPIYDEAWKTSPEMQVLDNEKNKDGLIYKHRAGDLYDLIACSEVTVKPQGEWNSVKVVKSGGKVEHWLNGVKVVEYDFNSPGWKEMISKSKFASLGEYATSKQCKIGLQDHDNRVWYRNIKIRKLK